MKPHALLITGDLVNHPWGKSFRHFERALNELYERVEEESKESASWIRKYTILVAGNHDVAWFANRFFRNPRRYGAFDAFHRRLLKNAGFTSAPEQVRTFFEESGVA